MKRYAEDPRMGGDVASSEELGDEIERISPEGRPGDPGAGPRQIGLLFVLFIILFLLVALVLAITVRPMVGVGVAAFTLMIFAVNPEVHASIIRARERKAAEEHVVERKNGTATE